MTAPQARPVEQEIAAVVGELVHDLGSELDEGWFIVGEGGYFDVDNACWCVDQEGDAPWTSKHFRLFGTIPDLIARERAAAVQEALTEAADAVARREDEALIAALLAMECNEPARMVSDWIGEMLREIEEMLRDRADRIGGDQA